MYACLEELLKTKNHVVCHLTFSKFKYAFDDSFTGKKMFFFLEEIVNLYEEKQVEKIKTNDFKVLIEPLKMPGVAR